MLTDFTPEYTDKITWSGPAIGPMQLPDLIRPYLIVLDATGRDLSEYNIDDLPLVSITPIPSIGEVLATNRFKETRIPSRYYRGYTFEAFEISRDHNIYALLVYVSKPTEDN